MGGNTLSFRLTASSLPKPPFKLGQLLYSLLESRSGKQYSPTISLTFCLQCVKSFSLPRFISGHRLPPVFTLTFPSCLQTIHIEPTILVGRPSSSFSILIYLFFLSSTLSPSPSYPFTHNPSPISPSLTSIHPLHPITTISSKK